MKKIYFLFLFSALGHFANAQQAFSSSGKVITSGNISLSYTIGEPLVSKEINGDIVLSSGFQNTLIFNMVTEIKNNSLNRNDLLVYPNPSAGMLNIENKATNTNLQIQVFNLQGQEVFHRNYIDLKSEQINLTQLSNGVYLLSVTDADKQQFNTYKIQIIQ